MIVHPVLSPHHPPALSKGMINYFFPWKLNLSSIIWTLVGKLREAICRPSRNSPTSDVLPTQRVGNIRHIRVSLDEVSLDDAVEDARIVVVGPLRP